MAASALTSVQAQAADPDVLNVSFGGSFSSGNTYTAATGEVMGGTLTRRSGAESLDPARGVVLGGGADGVRFQPSTALSGGDVQRSFLIETAYTPDATQGNLATITAIGGAIFGRYNGTNLQYGFSVESGGEWPMSSRASRCRRRVSSTCSRWLMRSAVAVRRCMRSWTGSSCRPRSVLTVTRPGIRTPVRTSGSVTKYTRRPCSAGSRARSGRSGWRPSPVPSTRLI